MPHTIEAIDTTTIPPKLHSRPLNSVKQEGELLLAISALKKKDISNICEAAYLYNMPVMGLYENPKVDTWQKTSCTKSSETHT